MTNVPAPTARQAPARPNGGILLFRAYCNCESSGPSFGMVRITPRFRRTAARRHRLLETLRKHYPDTRMTAVGFEEIAPVWFRWFSGREQLLDRVDEAGWTCLPAGAFELPENDESGDRIVCRSDCDEMILTRHDAFFACRMKNTDIRVRSERFTGSDMKDLILTPQ